MLLLDAHRRGVTHRGFVLIELVVVLVLLSIITAMVVPMYGGAMGNIQRRSTRNQLVGILLHIQERAVSETREYRFYFREDTGEYWVELESDTLTDDFEAVFEPVMEAYGRPAMLPMDYKFTDVGRLAQDDERDAYYIRCFPNGACNAVEFSVQDTAANKIAFSIELLGTLGQIRTETGE